MPDQETVLITVYVAADTFCAAQRPTDQLVPPPRRGPAPALTDAEVLTLATLAAHPDCPSERAFWRFAERHLRAAFPTLPHRSQFNRQRRRLADLLARFALACADPTDRATAPYEIMDGTAVPVRSAKRRGRSRLAGLAAIGHSTRLGWFYGFRLLLVVTPTGTITGFGLAPANQPDLVLADTLLAARARPEPGLPGAGLPAVGGYLADTGFAGRDCQRRWRERDAAVVRAPPHPASHDRWSGPSRRWLARHRQIVETVIGQVVGQGGLERRRPQTLSGAAADLAAAVSWHGLRIGLNRAAGRADLARIDGLAWLA